MAPPIPSPEPGDASARLAAEYAGLQKTGGQVYAIDSAASDVRIFVFRGGPAARFGHDHILSAPRFSGRVFLPDAVNSQARFDLVFRLDQLVVDPPALVDGMGSGSAARLTPEDRAGVRAHMLGERNMQADRYPLVGIHSLEVVDQAPDLAVRVEVEMHGRRRALWVPLKIRLSPRRIEASGALVLRQSDFGITPYSVLGGLLAVRDPVLIEFRLVGKILQRGQEEIGHG